MKGFTYGLGPGVYNYGIEAVQEPIATFNTRITFVKGWFTFSFTGVTLASVGYEWHERDLYGVLYKNRLTAISLTGGTLYYNYTWPPGAASAVGLISLDVVRLSDNVVVESFVDALISIQRDSWSVQTQTSGIYGSQGYDLFRREVFPTLPPWASARAGYFLQQGNQDFDSVITGLSDTELAYGGAINVLFEHDM